MPFREEHKRDILVYLYYFILFIKVAPILKKNHAVQKST